MSYVLVVEDHPLNQKLAAWYVRSLGLALQLAANATEVDAALAVETPLLILLDLSLPGEDGLSLARRLRQGPLNQLPIIALTAHAMPGDRERALEAGCTDYLSKPLELKTFQAKLAQYLPLDEEAV